MRTILAMVAAAAVLAAGAASASPRDERDIRALLDHWRAAFQKKDVAGVMAMYAPGARLTAYDIVPPLKYQGFDAYRTDYRAYFDQFSGPLAVEDREVHVAATGDIGYAYGLERVAGTLKSGEKTAMWTRFTTVFRKVGGRWYAVHDHVSVPTDFATGKAALDLEP